MDRRMFLTETLLGTTALVFGNTKLLADKKKLVFSLLKADVPNSNKRIYPRSLIEKIVKDFQSLPKNSLLGQLEMPTATFFTFRDASHSVSDLFIDGDYLMAEINPLDNPNGKILKSLLRDNVNIKFRTCGIASNFMINENEIQIINDDFQLTSINACDAMDLG